LKGEARKAVRISRRRTAARYWKKKLSSRRGRWIHKKKTITGGEWRKGRGEGGNVNARTSGA